MIKMKIIYGEISLLIMGLFFFFNLRFFINRTIDDKMIDFCSVTFLMLPESIRLRIEISLKCSFVKYFLN